MGSNVLAYLVWDENSMTRFLRGLLTIDDFCDAILQIFTRGKVNGSAISQHDIYTQIALDGLSIPDLAIFNRNIRLLAEIKTDINRQLTPHQPVNYLSWLSRQGPDGFGRFFVMVIPEKYRYRSELEARITNYTNQNSVSNVNIVVVTWEEIVASLRSSVNCINNIYIIDFVKFIEKKYSEETVQFISEEIEAMYSPHAATGLKKLMTIANRVIDGLWNLSDAKGFEKYNSRKNKFWQDEYAIYIQLPTKGQLYFGIWFHYWMEKGIPLCYAITSKADQSAIDKFRQLEPSVTIFPPNAYEFWHVADIEPSILEQANPDQIILERLDDRISQIIAVHHG